MYSDFSLGGKFIGTFKKAYLKYLLDTKYCELPYPYSFNYILNISDDELFISVTNVDNNLDYLHTTKNYPKNIKGFLSALEEIKDYVKKS